MCRVAVKADRIAERSFLVQVINLLNIDHVTFIAGEIQTSSFKLSLQYPQIKAFEVESGQVAVSDELRYFRRYRLETRFAGDIRVCNTVDLDGFLRDSNSGPDPFPESVRLAVRHYLQNSDLHYPIDVDRGASGFQVDDRDWAMELQTSGLLVFSHGYRNGD